MRVLLIGNYPHDAQESMQRFANMMLSGLHAAGITAELIVPQPYFGRLKQSGTGLGKWLGYIDKFLLFPIFLRRRLLEIRNQKSEIRDSVLVHICDHSNAFYTRFLQDVLHVVTCHDLLAVRSARGEVPENPTRWSGRQLQEMVVKGLARARHVACDSEATQRDIHRLIALPKDRVSVISIGFNYPYSPMPEPEARARIKSLLEASSPTNNPASQWPGFILHVGGNQWYKNRLGVLRIYARAVATNPATPNLVMVGKPFTAEMEAYVAANLLQDRIRSVEGCGNEDLRALYSLADLLLFPSLAEGFGWPVIEAQACGCAVLCSSIEPFPEVTRGTACMHDPADEPGFATEFLRLLAQVDARKALTAQGLDNARRFAPETMVFKYVECYQQLTRQFAQGLEGKLPTFRDPHHMISWIRNRFHPLWRLRRTAWFRALQNHVDFAVQVQHGRIRQHVMLLRDFALLVPHRGAETRTCSLFLKALQFHKPEFFLDVGANVGSYSWAAANFDSSLAIWLFEPDETNVRLLRKTMDDNKLSRARLIPMAVASQNGEIEFLVDDVSGATGSVESDSSNASSLHAHYQLRNRVTVKCCCLDSFVEELRGHRVVIKIDVEGAEDQALAGARQLLAQVKPVIFIECFETAKMAILNELGYRVYDLQEGSNWLAIPHEYDDEARQKISDLQSASSM